MKDRKCFSIEDIARALSTAKLQEQGHTNIDREELIRATRNNVLLVQAAKDRARNRLGKEGWRSPHGSPGVGSSAKRRLDEIHTGAVFDALEELTRNRQTFMGSLMHDTGITKGTIEQARKIALPPRRKP